MNRDIPGGDRRKFRYLPEAHNDLPLSPEPPPVFPAVPQGYACRYPCPCCGEITYPAPPGEAAGYICPVCFWESDGFTASDDEPSDENGGMTLNEARERYRERGIVRQDLLRHRFKLLLFDLDDTLLRRDKTISPRNLEKLRQIRWAGLAGIGVSTSRSEKNAAPFLEALRPDVLITSAGAHVRVGERVVFSAPFTEEETARIVQTVRELLGPGTLMDADTPAEHYRNYPVTEHQFAAGFEECVETDFSTPPVDPLMVCVKLTDPGQADRLREALPFGEIVKFVGSPWHKITKKGVTKAMGIEKACQALCLSPKNTVAFGDDLADVEMLELSGLGVAMGNAVPEVKAAADVVIGDNDSDAVADFLDALYRSN